MKIKLLLTIALCVVLGALLFIGAPAGSALADTNIINFESYSLGNINGQDGWSKTGAFDVAVVNNTYGYPSFGTKSLRISDSVTSGSFGDQTFAKPLVNAVGEAAATAGSFSVGTRMRHFEMQFDLASTLPSLQAGMHVSVSPDRGDGSRMSYLRFEDQSDGIHVYFDDVTDPGPVGTVATFNETDIATVSRSPHTIKLTMDMVDGPSNDVVEVWIDGVSKITGTSWEDYYRFDPEAAAEQSPRIVKTVLFRVSGTATPANAGNGFLVDNMSLSSSVPGDSTIVVTPSSPHGWFFYDDDYPGGVGDFVTGPATPPLGTGSAHMTLTGTARQTITTQAYAGTRFDKITNLEYYTYGSTSTLQFNIDFDLTDADNTTWMGRLVYIPSGGVTSGGWTKWSPMSGSWWTTAGAGKAVVGGVGGNSVCPVSCTWAQVLSNYPNAGIRLYDGGIHIKAGGPAPGFDGNVDAFTIGVDSVNTTFDFESGSTALVFVPDNAKMGVGGTTVIGINLNNVANLYGYQFTVSYNATNASASAWFGDSPTPSPRPAGFPPFTFFKTASASIPTGGNAECASGTCTFAVSHVAPQTAVTGSGPLAFIALTGLVPGTFTMTFNSVILSDINAVTITHVTNTADITVYGTTSVSGVVQLQGRATPLTSGTVTLTDLGGNFPPLYTNFSAADGTYSFSSVPVMPSGSTYQFDAAHSLYLTSRQTPTLTGAPYTAPTTTLRGGDAVYDGVIDISDLTCIGGVFGGSPSTCAGQGGSDINGDGLMNILDLVLAGGNFGRFNPQPW